MADNRTIALEYGDNVLRFEASKDLADRIDRAARRLNPDGGQYSKGDVWLMGLRKHGDDLKPDPESKRSGIYADVDGPEDAKKVFVRNVLDRIADDILDDRPSAHRIDQPLE